MPPTVSLSAKHLERNRIVSYAVSDPSHVPFKLLRTRLKRIMQANSWKTLAITSPTPQCGKTMVSINLAMSLAQSPNCRVVVVDLDLRKPAIARTLGVKPSGTVSQFLKGEIEAKDCFVQINRNLVIALTDGYEHNSSELLNDRRMDEFFRAIEALFAPDIVLFDLPPMRSGDDALVFLPKIDGALLVIAAGASTTREVEESETEISQLDKLIGIVLNKSDEPVADYYYYGGGAPGEA